MIIHPSFLLFQAGFSKKVTVTIYSITCFSRVKVLCDLGLFVCLGVLLCGEFFVGKKAEAFSGI